MSQQGTEDITQLLIELSQGNRVKVDMLLPLIYDELRRLAVNYLRREHPDHTLQATALLTQFSGGDIRNATSHLAATFGCSP